MAEQAGFDGIHSSDHFHPCSKRQRQSGFSFSWMGAAMQATQLPFSMVCAPGQRYHPAIVAQAIATLGELFPGRIDFELGSGEALNEVITGEEWPAKKNRNDRLLECVNIIRLLLAGEEVTYDGHVKVKGAKLYTLAKIQPRLFCAAISEETAAWAGHWADGLLTTGEPRLENNLKKIKAFSDNGGKHKPVYLQFAFSYARFKRVAEEEAFDQWRSNVLPKEKLAGLRTVKDFDNEGENTSKEDVLKVIPVYTDMNSLFNKIEELKQTGADRIILHNISRQQIEFIEDYGKKTRAF
jgi:coenzyme F420-dependent glucose-6-phosphate dehydrogenase